jgi:molecular chaperone DnaK (HSP70)
MTTPIFDLPFPDTDDAPDGPSQTQALAEAVETSLSGVNADLLSAIAGATNIYTQKGVCNANENVNATHEDAPGTSVTFATDNANAIAIIVAVWDLEFTNTSGQTSQHVIGYLSIDGVEQTAQGVLRCLQNNRGTVPQVYVVTLASAGNHTIKQRASCSATVGTGTVREIHTNWVALIIDKA